MFIPKSLQFFLNRMAAFNKNTIKLQPLNRTSFGPGDQVVFRLPANAMVDLHSLTMLFKLSTTGGGAPRHTSSLVQRVDVTANGVPLGLSGLADYASLYNIYMNLNAKQDMLLERNVLELGAATTTAAVAGKDCAITDWLGFLGGSYNRYLPLSILGTVEVRIQLAPGAVCPRTAPGTPATYALDGVSLVLETLSLDPVYYQMLDRKLQSGEPIVIPFKNFASFASSGGAGSSQTTFSLATQCLDALWGVPRASGYDTGSEVVAGGQAAYFAFNSLGSDTMFQWQIDSITYPQFLASPVDVYCLTKNALDAGGGNQGYANMVTDLADFKSNKFCHGLSLSLFCDQANERLASGLSTQGAMIPITWKVEGGSGNHRTTVFAEMTSTVQVQAGQLVTVIA